MALVRGTLAKIDRRILSELDHEEAIQLVKVPVSDAVWSTWRRYCEAAHVTMGRGLALMIESELAAMVDEDIDGLAEKIAGRETAVAEREATAAEREAEVERRRREVEIRERQISEAPDRSLPGKAKVPIKVGRNEPCWCGSKKKFKYCHGVSKKVI